MITLQHILFPDIRVCTEHPLYFRPQGEFGFSQGSKNLWLARASLVRFDTYFNMFNLTRWHSACNLDGLFLEITGTGHAEIRVFQAIPNMSWEVLYCEVTTLDANTPHLADLSDYAERVSKGLIYVEVKSLDPAGTTFMGGRFMTRGTPRTLPRLAISITTFKREDQVRKTVQRLESFLEHFPFRDMIRVQVVDNGQSAGIEATKRVTPFANPNYGGAGGFARGLLEAEKAGFTHCLFMDDDAVFPLENITRTYSFLALAKDPRTAMAGAMINNAHKFLMWENGATFDGGCTPLYCGTDLRNRDAVIEMEFKAAQNRPPNFYGGWWFFAFAIDQVRHHPFPFFVRGDDVSFSLMNDFDIHTLNGVVSFQDAFAEKESPMVHYLNLRSHLIHHMVDENLEYSAKKTAKIATKFVMNSLLRLHYESAEAQLAAWRDMMEGPDFFDRHIDLAQRRAEIGSLTSVETWRPAPHSLPKVRKRLNKKSKGYRKWLGDWTLNGHLLPFSGRRWDRIILDADSRPFTGPAFGASQITYLNTTRDMSYTVTQSKSRFFRVCKQMFRTRAAFLRQYEDLKTAYRSGYDQITTRSFWETKLKD